MSVLKSVSCLSLVCVSASMQVHVERVHMKKKQQCSFCNKMYSDVKTLLKHMEKQHNLKDPGVQESYQQLRCQPIAKCAKLFSHDHFCSLPNKQLTCSLPFSRLKTRQGVRQLLYLCSTCNRRFKNKPDRDRHQLVHGPQQPFACHLCHYAATKQEVLAAHVRKHLFLYVCSECEGNFASSLALTDHLKQCHGELEPKQAFAASISRSFYLVQPGEDFLGDQHEQEDADRSSQECPAQQSSKDELEGSRVTSEEKQRSRSQPEGQKEEKQATGEANKTEESQDGLQVVLSPPVEEAELAASDAQDSQSQTASSEQVGEFGRKNLQI